MRAASLLHELIHAAGDCASGLRGAFAQAATRLGLHGLTTVTRPSVELAAEMITLADALGPFPHAKLDLCTATDSEPGARPAPPAIPAGGVLRPRN
jgi:hypothetical protein